MMPLWHMPLAGWLIKSGSVVDFFYHYFRRKTQNLIALIVMKIVQKWIFFTAASRL
jgi:hypothetical protein